MHSVLEGNLFYIPIMVLSKSHFIHYYSAAQSIYIWPVKVYLYGCKY